MAVLDFIIKSILGKVANMLTLAMSASFVSCSLRRPYTLDFSVFGYIDVINIETYSCFKTHDSFLQGYLGMD
jgi:hypothetical protein